MSETEVDEGYKVIGRNAAGEPVHSLGIYSREEADRVLADLQWSQDAGETQLVYGIVRVGDPL